MKRNIYTKIVDKSRVKNIYSILFIALFLVATIGIVLAVAPEISFVDPTPANVTGINQTFIANITTSDSTANHYVFTNFENDLVLYTRADEVNGSGNPIDLSRYGDVGNFVNGSSINSSGLFGSAFQTNTDRYIQFPDRTHSNMYYKSFIFDEKSGDLNSHQGLSYNDTWLWSYHDNVVYKRNGFSPFSAVITNNTLQNFAFSGQNHFGDGDLYNNSIWIANTRYVSCSDFDTPSNFKINANTLLFEENINLTGDFGTTAWAGITVNDDGVYGVDFCDNSRILHFHHNGTFIGNITLTYGDFGGTPSAQHQALTLRENDEMYGEDVFYIAADGNIDRIYVFNKTGSFLNIVKSFEPDSNSPAVEGLDFKNSNRLAIIIDKDGNQEAEFFKPYIGGHTISAWFYKYANTGTFPGIVSIGGFDHRNAILSLDNGQDNLFCGYEEDGGANAFVTGATPIVDNVWYHAVYTWNGTQVRCYLDGVLDNTGEFSLVPADSEVGILIGSNAIADDELNGLIDEVIILNRAITPEEVASLYNATANPYNKTFEILNITNTTHTIEAWSANSDGDVNSTGERTFYYPVGFEPPPPPEPVPPPTPQVPFIEYISPTPANASEQASTSIRVRVNSTTVTNETNQYVLTEFEDDLVLWHRYDFLNGTGAVIDNSSYGNNGIATDGGGNTSGAFGEAYNFTATSTEIVVSADDSLYLEDKFTLSFWAYINTASGGGKYIFNKANHSTFGSLGCFDATAEGFHATVSVGVISFIACNGTSRPIITASTTDELHHYVLMFDESSMSLYIDGAFHNSTSISGGVGNLENLEFGTAFGAGLSMTGYLDEFIILNRTLSQSEINSLYNSTASPYDHTFSGLTVNETYHFQSFAVGSGGLSNQTDLRFVSLTDPPVPAESSSLACSQPIRALSGIFTSIGLIILIVMVALVFLGLASYQGVDIPGVDFNLQDNTTPLVVGILIVVTLIGAGAILLESAFCI